MNAMNCRNEGLMTYIHPLVEELSVRVEEGFAASFVNGDLDEDTSRPEEGFE